MIRRGLILLAACAGLAALFFTASGSPGPRVTEAIRLSVVSFNPHAGPVLKVTVRGGSCSFSLSARDDYSYQCHYSGGKDPTARVVARARPLLRRHGLCVHTYVTLAGSWPLVYRCSKGLGMLALP